MIHLGSPFWVPISSFTRDKIRITAIAVDACARRQSGRYADRDAGDEGASAHGISTK
jgi:hypothetical protein